MMNARLSKTLVALLAVVAVGACDDPPIEPGSSDAARLATNPTFAVIEAGETRLIQTYLVNEVGNPVAGEVDFDACNGLITVVEDEDQLDIEPGTNLLVTAGGTLGESCINVSAGGFEETITIRIVPSEIVVTAATDTVRAGDSGSIDVTIVDADGNPVTPFDEGLEITYTSSNTRRLFFTDTLGGFDTDSSGAVIVTATYELFGVTRTLEIPITVLPGLPVTGDIAGTTFGSIQFGDTVSAAIILRDTAGPNLSNLDADIDSIVLTSSNTAVATAWAVIEPLDNQPGRVRMTAYVAGVGGGTANISGTAYTVNGAISLGTNSVTVVQDAVINSILPAGQNAGENVVIAGSGLQQSGSATTVEIDGVDVTDYIVLLTPTAITLELPVAGEARTVEVTVDVGGATSDQMDYAFGGEASEPQNDVDGTPVVGPAPGVPFTQTGWLGFADDYDFFRFTAPASGNITINGDWDQASVDVDFAVFNWATGSFGNCAGGASVAKPEQDLTCTVTAGTEYGIYVNHYSLSADGDTQPTEYSVTLAY